MDWRNAQLSNGKVFEGSANKPFSGKVTNVPYAKIIRAQLGYQQLMGQGGSIVTMLFGSALLCDIQVDDGVLDGDVICRRSQQKDYEIETRLEDGVSRTSDVPRSIPISRHSKEYQMDLAVKSCSCKIQPSA